MQVCVAIELSVARKRKHTQQVRSAADRMTDEEGSVRGQAALEIAKSSDRGILDSKGTPDGRC